MYMCVEVNASHLPCSVFMLSIETGSPTSTQSLPIQVVHLASVSPASVPHMLGLWAVYHACQVFTRVLGMWTPILIHVYSKQFSYSAISPVPSGTLKSKLQAPYPIKQEATPPNKTVSKSASVPNCLPFLSPRRVEQEVILACMSLQTVSTKGTFLSLCGLL